MELRLLALACLVGAALAGPFQRNADSRCSQECSPTSSKFRYEPGKVYVYSYKAWNDVTVADGRKQQKTELNAKVEIHVKDRCDMILQLRQVRFPLTSNEDTQSLIEKLETHPLSFSWSDGKIESVCSSPGDSEESLNIKKAMVSAFVNTQSDFTSSSKFRETDGLGTCDTKYTSKGEYRGKIEVHKEKMLKTCDNRHAGISALVSNPYPSQGSDFESAPVFAEDKLECDQEVENGVFTKTVCTERALLKPLSKQATLAEFKGVISLTLEDVTESRGIRQPSEMQRKPIKYSYSQEDDDVEEKHQEVRELLSQLCSETRTFLRPSVAKLYYKLVKAVRSLSVQSIERVYEELKTGRLCDSPKALYMFLDALPMAGSEGAVKLMVKTLREKEITGLKAKLWPASLALVPNPTAGAIAAVTPLLTGEERSDAVLLGVSAMVYRVCSNRDCNRVDSVKQVVAHLHRSLGERCSSDNEDEVISVLKAFGNMGYIGEAKHSILQCATSQTKSINIRLAAVDAFRRTQEKRPSELLRLYSDSSENYEVRIAALTSAVKHPDPSVFRAMEKVLQSERDEQVVAFTASLLKNMQETSSPLKQEHRRLAQEVHAERSDVGYWENSKNVEISAFNRPLNVGGSIESNIIHAPRSKLPRSGSARLDIDLFGRNVNLVEFGLRTEGLEKALKKLMGRSDKHSEKSWLRKALEKIPSDSESDKPEFSFYLRTMDTEVLDLSSSDLTSLGSMVQYADVLNKLSKGGKVDFAHSFVFADTKLVVPSVTGRSYALSFTGTTTVGLSANGKFDVLNLMNSPKNCDVEGRFQPSVNVELAATVGFHSEKSRPDMKIVTTFHSDSDVEAKLLLKDGHLLQAKWNLPSEKLQLLKFSTNVFEVDSNNVERPLLEEMRTILDHCTKSLAKPLGVEVCGKVEIPHPYVSRTFPFSKGLGNVELYVRKTESSMQGYEVSVEFPRYKSNAMSYRMTFDTPGSHVERKFEAHLEMKKSPSEEREFKLDLHSPFKTVSSSGSFVRHPEQIEGAVNVVLDRSRRYSMKTVVETHLSGPEKMIKPSIQFTFPESEPLSLSGSVTLLEGRKQQMMFDFRSNKPNQKPIVLTGTLMKEGRLSFSKNDEWRMSSDLVAKSPWISLKIRGATDKQSHQSRSFSSSISIDYQLRKERRQALRFSSKAQQKDSGKLSSTAQFESTQKPSWNWLLSWDLQGKLRETMKNDVVFKYGENPERTYFHVTQMSKFGDKASLSEAKLSMKAPHLGIDSELNAAADLNFKSNSNFHVETDLRYKGNNHVKSLIKLQKVSMKPLKMSLRAQLEFPGKRMSYTDEIEESSPGEYCGNSVVQWKEGKQASLKYTYRRLSSGSTFHHELESTLQTPASSRPVEHKSVVKLNSESFHFENKLMLSRKQEYLVNADLHRYNGPSEINVRIPKFEGSLKIQNDKQLKSINMDVNCHRHSLHVIASGQLKLGQKKSLEGEIYFDADRNPSAKASLQVTSETTSESYNVATQIQYLDSIKVKAESRGKRSVVGSHYLVVDVEGRSVEPVTLTLRHEGSSSDIHCILSFEKSHSEKAKVEIQGKMSRKSSGTEISGGLSLKSKDGSIEERELKFNHFHSKSSSSLSCKSHVRLQSSSNEVYTCQLELSHQTRQSTDFNVQITSPHQRFRMQKFQVHHRLTGSRNSVEASVEYGSSEKATMMSILDKTRGGKSYSLIVTTPSRHLREAKYFVAYENRRTKKQIESHLELNGKLMYDAAVEFEKQSGKFEARSHLQTTVTPKLEAIVKSENDGQSQEHEVLITKDSRKVFSGKVSKQKSRNDVRYSVDIQDSQKSLLDVTVAEERQGDTYKYLAKAKGSFAPISVNVQATKNDEKSMSLSASACRESSRRECFNVKGYYKNEENTSKYRQYKKLTLDFEKSSGHFCSLSFLLADQDRSLKSKFYADFKGTKVGYDLQLNKRRSEEEPGSIDLSVQLPSQAAKANVRFHQNPRILSYEFEFVPDVSAPSKRFSAGMKKELRNTREIDLSGHVKFSHDVLEMPVHVSFSALLNPSKTPAKGKLEVEYSRRPSDKLTVELELETDRRQPNLQSYVYKIYSGDRALDLVVEVFYAGEHRSESSRQFGWQWIWQPQRGHKAGGLLVTYDHDSSSNTPCSTNVTYYSPGTRIVLFGRTRWVGSLPQETKWQLTSNEELVGEAELHIEGSCTELELRHSDPVWRTKLCNEEPDEEGKRHVSFECYYEGRKSVDASCDFNPSRWQVSHLGVHWKKEELFSAARSLKHLPLSLKDYELEKVEAEMCEQVKRIATSFKAKVWEPLEAQIKAEFRQFLETHQERLRELKHSMERYMRSLPSWEEMREKYVDPFIRSARKQLEEVKQKIRDCLPESVKDLMDNFQRAMDSYKDRLCPRGSFCDQVLQTYRRRGVRQTRKLVQEKLIQIYEEELQKAKDWFPSWKKLKEYLREFEHFLKKVLSPFEAVLERFKTFFDGMEKIAERVEHKLRQYYEEVKEWLERVFREALENEDFRVISNMISDAKHEMKKEWKQADFVKMLKTMRSGIFEAVGPQHWIHEKLSIHSDIKNGSFELQMRQPFDQSKITLIKNGAFFLKKKFQQFHFRK